MKRNWKLPGGWLVFVLLGVAAMFLLAHFQGGRPQTTRPIAEFQRDLDAGDVEEVQPDGSGLIVTLDGGERYFTPQPLDMRTANQLAKQHVRVSPEGSRAADHSGWIILLVAGVVAVVVILLIRRARMGMYGGFLNLLKSRARLIPETSKVRFADVAGCDDAKQQLADVVNFLNRPQLWLAAGARLPRGVLLEGPPGCGKTLLARAVAGEARAKFFLAPASEFVEMFVGVGAARVRDTFETARKQAPAVIFIDEIDAVGRRRGTGLGTSHDEREQTLNQLLLCLESLEGAAPLVVIAATNRADILDTALLRPGRFDRRIIMPPLDPAGRRACLAIHTRNKKLAADVSLETLSARTDGYSGARLENLANEAALLAVRRTVRQGGAGQQGSAGPQAGLPAELTMDDFLRALQAPSDPSHGFDQLDLALIESNSRLTRPEGRAVVRVHVDGACLEGELIWADAHFLKIRGPQGEAIVAKPQVRRLESLPGTMAASEQEVQAQSAAQAPVDAA